MEATNQIGDQRPAICSSYEMIQEIQSNVNEIKNDMQKKIKSQEKALEDVARKLETAEIDLRAARAKVDETEENLTSLRDKLHKTTINFNNAQGKLDEKDNDLKLIQKTLNQTYNDLLAAQVQLKELSLTKADLQATQEKHEITENELESAKEKLRNTQIDLQAAQEKLTNKENELILAKENSDKLEGDLQASRNWLNEVRGQLNKTQIELQTTLNILNETRSKLKQAEETIEKNNLEISGLKFRFGGFDFAVKSFVEIMNKTLLCESTKTIVSGMEDTGNTEVILKFLRLFGNEFTYAAKIYNSMRDFKRINRISLTDEEKQLISVLNQFYRKNEGIEYDILEVMDLSKPEVFDKQMMQDFDKPADITFRFADALYVPALRKDADTIQFKAFIKGVR